MSQDVAIEMGTVGGAAAPDNTVEKKEGGTTAPADGQNGTSAGGEGEKEPEEKYHPRCESLMKYYVCNFMGHEYHFTEFMCLIAFGGCVLAGIYVMYDGKLDTKYFAILLMIYALFGLVFVWDFATIASLADLANQLDMVRQRCDVENNKYALINSALEDQTKLYGEQLGVLGDESNAIREEVKKFDDQLQKLHNTQKVQEDLLNLQIELGDAENRFARIMAASSIDRAKELKKNALNILFTERAAIFNKYGEGMIPRTEQNVQVIRHFWQTEGIDPEGKFKSQFEKLLKKEILMNHKFIALADQAMRTRVFRLRTVKERLAAKTKVLERRKVDAELLEQKFKENIEALRRGEEEKYPGLVYDPEADKKEEREELKRMNVFADGTDSEEDSNERPNFMRNSKANESKESKDNNEPKIVSAIESPVAQTKAGPSASKSSPPPKLPPKTVTIHREHNN